MVIDVLERGDLPFPRSLPEFQRIFPDEAACAAYLERARWGGGFICPCCATVGSPYRFANRPTVLRCRHCQHNSYPFNAFRSLLGIAGDVTAPTYAELYAKKSQPTTNCSLGH